MEKILIYLFIGIAVVVFFYIFYKMINRLIVNSITGLVLLFILKYVFMIDIPINLVTLAVTALFGLGGVGSLLILKIGNMI
ncbi:MAG: hypothetical protein DRO95_00610 [Candidatus Altiarchaeales archaeon]|nr:MAG: hypothetical protein DRO95_00610 [Candidatus Altiarchaeales archaeon]